MQDRDPGGARCTHCGGLHTNIRCWQCQAPTHTPNYARDCSLWGWGGDSYCVVCMACCEEVPPGPKAKEALDWQQEMAAGASRGVGDLSQRPRRSGVSGRDPDQDSHMPVAYTDATSGPDPAPPAADRGGGMCAHCALRPTHRCFHVRRPPTPRIGGGAAASGCGVGPASAWCAPRAARKIRLAPRHRTHCAGNNCWGTHTGPGGKG